MSGNPSRFFYRIDGLNLGHGMHQAGFSVEVDARILAAASRQLRRADVASRLTQLARERLLRAGLVDPLLLDECNIVYSGATWLPMFFAVPGNSCEIGLDGQERDELERRGAAAVGDVMTLHPHNVDTPQQALSLLLMFQAWAEFAGCGFLAGAA